MGDGWAPPRAESVQVVESARGSLRVRVRVSFVGFEQLEPGVFPDAAAEGGCRRVGSAPLGATVRSSGILRVAPLSGRRTIVTVEWQDEYGLGRVQFSMVERRFLDLAQPLTTARLTVSADAPVRVCGLG